MPREQKRVLSFARLLISFHFMSPPPLRRCSLSSSFHYSAFSSCFGAGPVADRHAFNARLLCLLFSVSLSPPLSPLFNSFQRILLS